MDLFAGCGGMSLGFQKAGFTLMAAVESDPLAAESHAANFFQSARGVDHKTHASPRDITETRPETLMRELGLGDVAMAIDVLVGGPPCQAFARVGRAKLREIADHPEAFRNDERANLYLSFIRYVAALQPLAVVMENVPDVINFGGYNIPEEMCEALEAMGYEARYTLLNSALYGVPQMRERMFLIALAKELDQPVTFPSPKRRCDIPRGYEGSRQVALKHVGDLLAVGGHFVRPLLAGDRLPFAVTAREALGDLPRITLHLEGKLKRGARRFTELAPYPQGVSISRYAEELRTWPDFEGAEGVYDHVIRYLPRDYAIFRRMRPGDQYPEAHRLALRMLDEEVSKRLRSGATVAEKNALLRTLRETIVPPYDAGKFPNKWRKMEADAPARTLMAHLGKDSYSHIHYDDSQARTISVREAARLQSFPDGFRFCGTMNPAFRQIGNAVPPLLANAIAEVVRKALPVDG
jgi:DNA (cytosine-5)-methyltransferase 1